MSYREQAEELYEKRYKGRGLAPKHVVALKEVIAKALKKGDKPTVAAKKWLKEKGIELTASPADAESETPPAKKKKEEEAKASPTATVEKTPVDYAKLDLKNLDRKSLKAVIMELHGAGVTVKVPFGDDGQPRVKKMEDHELLRAVSTAINSLPSPETIQALERIDPSKLTPLLKQDCIGIYVDLTTPECLACPDKHTCTKKFIENLKGNFKVFKDAMTDIKTEEAAKAITDEEIDTVSKKSKDKGKKVRRLKYDPRLTVFVMNVPHPEKDKKADAYEMVQAILDHADDADFAPITLEELYEIASKHFEYTPQGMMEEFFPQLRVFGIIKLEEELTKDEREAYQAALAG